MNKIKKLSNKNHMLQLLCDDLIDQLIISVKQDGFSMNYLSSHLKKKDLIHTLIVYQNVKFIYDNIDFSKIEFSISRKELLLAALWHDFGKSDTIRKKHLNDYNKKKHPKYGAKFFKKNGNEIINDKNISIDNISEIILNHSIKSKHYNDIKNDNIFIATLVLKAADNLAKIYKYKKGLRKKSPDHNFDDDLMPKKTQKLSPKRVNYIKIVLSAMNNHLNTISSGFYGLD